MDERLRKYQRAAYAGGGTDEWSAYARLLEPLAGVAREEEEPTPFENARLASFAKKAIGDKIKDLEARDLLKKQQERVLESLLHHGIDENFGAFEISVPNLHKPGEFTNVRIKMIIDWEAASNLNKAGKPYDEDNPPRALSFEEHTYRRYRSIGSWEALTDRETLTRVCAFLLEDAGETPA